MAVIVGLGGLGWSGSWILVAIALLVGLVGVDIRTGTTGLSGHQDRSRPRPRERHTRVKTELVVCPKCGAENSGKNNFCGNCATDLREVTRVFDKAAKEKK